MNVFFIHMATGEFVSKRNNIPVSGAMIFTCIRPFDRLFWSDASSIVHCAVLLPVLTEIVWSGDWAKAFGAANHAVINSIVARNLYNFAPHILPHRIVQPLHAKIMAIKRKTQQNVA